MNEARRWLVVISRKYVKSGICYFWDVGEMRLLRKGEDDVLRHAADGVLKEKQTNEDFGFLKPFP